ncbi:peptidase S8/S53 domain-containing protein [Lactarius quietus]|nr:peptidase S8/S53 domain-containing protein [Lactarius quietus]
MDLHVPLFRCRYGEHLSREQVAELVAPHPRTLKLVNTWLKHNGIPSSSVTTQGGNTLMLKAVPVIKANTLLDASYQLYRHVESHETIVRTVGYGLPAALHEHVRTVVPTTAFVPSLKQWQIPRNISGRETAAPVKSALGQPTTMLSNRVDATEVDPNIMRWMYGMDPYKPTVRKRNVVGIVGAIGNFPSPADLTMFMGKYRRDALAANFRINYVNAGPNDQRNADPDVNIQYLEALVFPTPVVYYVTSYGPSGTDDWFMTWLRYLQSLEFLPRTISGSFGFDEDTLPMEYAVEACQLFAELSARGVTFLFASGDDGVGEGDCVNSEGLLKFRTTFPATCTRGLFSQTGSDSLKPMTLTTLRGLTGPYVTAVGGTTGFEPGSAATFSGGGFSNYFERPDFQVRAVRGYLQQLGERNLELFNAEGRGIPDLSAQAVGFKIVVNGDDRYSSSTGMSTTVVAGLVALLNDWRLSKYRSSRGWINPWLYGYGRSTITDVTDGQNEGCSIRGLGFPALKGWDPVTGIGMPDFTKMKDKSSAAT